MENPAFGKFIRAKKKDGSPPSLTKVLEELRGLRQHVTTQEGAQRLSAAEQLVIMHSRVEDAGATLASDGPHVSLHSKALKWQSQKDRVDAIDQRQPINSLMLANPATPVARKFLLDRFGIPFPDEDTASATSDTIPAHTGMAKGLNAPPAIYVSAESAVHGNSVALLRCLDRELKHGLMHLVNRGLLPQGIDLTAALSGERNVLYTSSANLLPAELKHMGASSAWEAARVYGAASRADARHSFPRIPEIHGGQEEATDGEGVDVFQEWQTAEDGPGDPVTAALHNSPEHKNRSAAMLSGEPEHLARSAARLSGEAEQQVELDDTGQPVERSSEVIAGEGSGESTREYEQLMDEHSGHYILIRKGETLDNTPEFESFQRVCGEQWPAVASLLLQIEAICVQYDVPTATVDGKKLGPLADQVAMGAVCNLESLLACIENIQEVAEVLQKPGQRFRGPGGRDAAAVAIQTYHRGYMARLDLRGRRNRDQACRHIQSEWRRHRLREDVKERLQEAREVRAEQYQALQKKLLFDWETMRTQHRVVIHLPSLSASPIARVPGEDLVTLSAPSMGDGPSAGGTCASDCEIRQLESAQLPRICDVADPKVDVLFVSPVPLSEEVERYWNLVLAQGGVSRPESRYRVVYPENSTRMPSRLSLTAKLLSSPRAMRRLAISCKDRPAVIIPSAVTEAEIELATALNVPLLGASPPVVAAVQAKAGSRALFQRARMNVAPGLCVQPVDGTSEVLGAQDAVQALDDLSMAGWGRRSKSEAAGNAPGGRSVLGGGRANMKVSFTLRDGDLVVKDKRGDTPTNMNERKDRILCEHIAKAMLLSGAKTIQRWLIKLEDEDSVRGLAFFDVTSITGLDGFLRDTLQQLGQAARDLKEADGLDKGLLRAGTKVAMVLPAGDLRAQAEVNIRDMLLRDLRKALSIVCTRAYPDYRAYVQGVRQKGAIIEAAAAMVLGSPSACVLVEPTGDVKVIATMERMFHPTYTTVGHVFPQVSVTHSALADAATAIGETLASIGFIGHAQIDFTVLRNANSLLRMWATDLSAGPSLALAAFQLFDFLSAGDFAPRSGIYAVNSGTSSASSTGDLGPDSVNNEGSMNDHVHVAERCYVSCEMVAIQDQSVGFEGVLQACSTLNVGFDMATRSGIAFSVFERMRGGFLGLLGSGVSHAEAMNSTVRALEIVMGTLHGAGGASRETGLRGLIASLKFLASRLDPLAHRNLQGH